MAHAAPPIYCRLGRAIMLREIHPCTVCGAPPRSRAAITEDDCYVNLQFCPVCDVPSCLPAKLHWMQVWLTDHRPVVSVRFRRSWGFRVALWNRTLQWKEPPLYSLGKAYRKAYRKMVSHSWRKPAAIAHVKGRADDGSVFRYNKVW